MITESVIKVDYKYILTLKQAKDLYTTNTGIERKVHVTKLALAVELSIFNENQINDVEAQRGRFRWAVVKNCT